MAKEQPSKARKTAAIVTGVALAGVAVVGSFVGSAHDASRLTEKITKDNVLEPFQGVTASFTGREAHLSGNGAQAAIGAVEDVYGVRWAKVDAASDTPAVNVPSVDLPTVEIAGIEGGGATLNGAVPSDAVKADLEANAKAVFGEPVTNNLTVDPKLTAPDWLGKFQAALPGLPAINGGGISLDGKGLKVSGLVADTGALDGVKTALGALPGLSADFSGLQVQAPTISASPSVDVALPSVSMTASDAGVTLTGTVPSQEAKDQLVAEAKRIYGTDNVNADGVTVDANAQATPWFTGFLGALPQLPTIKGGSISLGDMGLDVSGEVADEATVGTVTDLLKGAVSLPSQSINLTAPAAPTPEPTQEPEPAPSTMPDDVAKSINGIVVHFPTSSTAISGAERKRLDGAIAQMKKFPTAKLELDGYVSLPNQPETRIPLSKARADVVKQYLVKGGIDAGRITSVGKGASNPVASNNTAAGRLANQRVQLVVTER